MASNDKTFYYYFKMNMKETGLPCPETLFEKTTAAIANIGLLADYVAKNHGVKASRMFKDIPKIAQMAAVGGAAGATPVVASTVAKSSVFLLEIGAAFYVGACIGSLFVATAKSGADIYKKALIKKDINNLTCYGVHEISVYARQKNITMSSEVQKVLHRNPQLYQVH
jgi:hypothetical protein